MASITGTPFPTVTIQQSVAAGGDRWLAEGLSPRWSEKDQAPQPLTRTVKVAGRSLEQVGRVERLAAGDATFTVHGLVADPHESEESRLYRATLTFGGGLRPVRVAAVLEVTRYGRQLADLTIRTARLPRRVSLGAYLSAATTALGNLKRQLEPVAPAPVVAEDLAEAEDERAA